MKSIIPSLTPSLIVLAVKTQTTTAVRGRSSVSDGVSVYSNNRKLSWDMDGWFGNVWEQITGSIGFDTSGDYSGDEYVIQNPEDANGNGNGTNYDLPTDWEFPDSHWDWNEWLSNLLMESTNGSSGFLNGRGDGFSQQNGEGLGDLLDGLDFGNLDFGNIGSDGLDVCALVELGIGMSASFGIEASCVCSGGLATSGTVNGNDQGLEIRCSFDECAPGDSEVCGTIDLTLEFGGQANDPIVKAGVCTDFRNDEFEETCFSYEMSMEATSTEGGDTSQQHSCEASYGGNPCECSLLDNSMNLPCLSIDCTPFLPGGKLVDTCQVLSMVDANNLANWFPNFEAFVPGFDLGPGLPNNNGGGDDNTNGDIPDPEEDLPVTINIPEADKNNENINVVNGTTDPIRPSIGDSEGESNGGITVLQANEMLDSSDSYDISLSRTSSARIGGLLCVTFLLLAVQ